MKCTTLGIGVAKSVFQLHGVDKEGEVVVQKRVSRGKLLETVVQLPACLIGMEAGGSAQYWAREFQRLGHTVKLISPQFVKLYVIGNKNDSRDAEAICEAVSRPHMRFVPLKTLESHDIQTIHRMRSRLIKVRTVVVSQILREDEENPHQLLLVTQPVSRSAPLAFETPLPCEPTVPYGLRA
jgi:transposase